MQVLLDDGISDSFVHPRIVHHLNLPVEPVHLIRVFVGNGQVMRGMGLVRVLPITINGHMIHILACVRDNRVRCCNWVFMVGYIGAPCSRL